MKKRETMLKATEKLTENEKTELTKNLEIRDRLFRRLTKKKVISTFSDDLGEFTIETRLMTGKERAQFLVANKKLSEAQNEPEKYEEAFNSLKSLAASICLTPDLDPDFWMGGEVSDDVVLTLILNAFNGAAQAVMDGVSSFRPK